MISSYLIVEGEDALENHELLGLDHPVLARRPGVRDEAVDWNLRVLQFAETL